MKLGSILQSLGVYGCGGIEDGVLAGLALGDPILLIGAPGSAKNTLAERLARALHRVFWTYDASKAMFEDVVGFPDPRTLHEGRVGYLQTPLTIWDKEFILVDELSRATAGMQNKWLEVIRSRRVMGVDLPRLKIVIAAMNPAGLLGTSPLDDALAGRFTFLLDMPEIHEMGDLDRRRVISNRATGDAVAVARDDSGPTLDLRPMLERIRGFLPWAERRFGEDASTYTDSVGAYFASRDIFLDGRRLGMIRRALIGLCAVHRATGCLAATSRGLLPDLCRHALDMTLPFRAIARPMTRMVVDSCHAHAEAAMRGRTRPLLPQSNLLGAVQCLLADASALADPDRISLLVTRITNAVERPTKIEPAIQAAAGLVLLVGHPDLLGRIRPEARHRLLACWREQAALGRNQLVDFTGQTAVSDIETRLPEEALAGVLRIAFRLARRLDSQPSISCSFDDVAPKLVALVEEGGVS